MTPDYWPKAIRHLKKADPTLAAIIAAYKGEQLQLKGDGFKTLARAIVGQQISVKAADAVWGKLGIGIQDSGFRELSVEAIGRMHEDALRACGLSRQKVVYLKAIAAHFERHTIQPGYFDAMSDEEVIKELVSIKGIGKWTAEMFLIFHLMRPDLFPVDDIGVQKAIERHYSPAVTPANAGVWMPSCDGMTKKEYYAALNQHAERWRPYRTVATWYLWRALDPVVVAY